MDTQTTENAKKIQVNAELRDELANAFERFRDTTGIRLTAPAVRALIVPRLQELGFLRAEFGNELQAN